MELTSKERLFCYYYVKLQNPKEAAVRAGYPLRLAEINSAKLLQRLDISDYINAFSTQLEQSYQRSQILSGIIRLAFGSVNDAVKLALFYSNMTEQEIDALDLFHISQITKQADGRCEVKFFDRFKALEKLGELIDQEKNRDSIHELFSALEQGAKSLNEGVEADEPI